ncbi:formyltransferase family protein [Candidatus Pelagibacter sp. Uisw_099_02]|uniref:formyltransferase family protein n=1 Tax=Candidatus Pelagibacter sp. Uisw_099_02 TaxID=3230981 RepID=UPI0039E83198|tara:strand:- start:301 stop:942 length:642 start_codon:yes stop_codon:yes gene_type:complete
MKKTSIALLLDSNNAWIIDVLKKTKYKNILKAKIFWDLKKINNYDLVFIINYTKIIPKEILKKNRFNLVVHSSNLPRGKGFAPLQWQILENKKKIVFTMININEKIDHGDIVLQSNLLLNGLELYEELRVLQANKILKMINHIINIFPNIKLKKQKGKSTFYKKRNKLDSKMNINKSIKSQFNKLRIVNNEQWPAFFYYKNKKFIIKIFDNDK